MRALLWYPIEGLSDANKLFEVAIVTRAIAVLLNESDTDDGVHLPRPVCGVVTDLLNKVAELAVDIANDLNSELGGNVRHCACHKGGAS